MELEVEWKREWFSSLAVVPKAYWSSMENRRKFMDKLTKDFNIRNPSDWGKLTTRDIRKSGGVSLLSNYYNNSLFRCLKSIYTGDCKLYMILRLKEVQWKKEWFPTAAILPKSYWTSPQNRREFLGKIKVKFGIKEPKDWGKIRIQDIKQMGGVSLLKYYKGSLFRCLQSVYKGSS